MKEVEKTVSKGVSGKISPIIYNELFELAKIYEESLELQKFKLTEASNGALLIQHLDGAGKKVEVHLMLTTKAIRENVVILKVDNVLNMMLEKEAKDMMKRHSKIKAIQWIIVMDNLVGETIYGLTVYRIYNTENSNIKAAEYTADNDEVEIMGFISFENISNLRSGLLTLIWSCVEFKDNNYLYDRINIGFKLFTLKEGDILELLKAHGKLEHLKVKLGGLIKVEIDDYLMR